MRIKWLRFALADIAEIAEYISKDNPNAALKLVGMIWHQSLPLKDHPEIGRAGRVMNTRELVIENSKYIIPYWIIDDEIQILRVFHSSRKWPDRFDVE